MKSFERLEIVEVPPLPPVRYEHDLGLHTVESHIIRAMLEVLERDRP